MNENRPIIPKHFEIKAYRENEPVPLGSKLIGSEKRTISIDISEGVYTLKEAKYYIFEVPIFDDESNKLKLV